jgi:hypothetical protein
MMKANLLSHLSKRLDKPGGEIFLLSLAKIMVEHLKLIKWLLFDVDHGLTMNISPHSYPLDVLILPP